MPEVVPVPAQTSHEHATLAQQSADPEAALGPRLHDELLPRLRGNITPEQLAVWAARAALSDDDHGALIAYLHATWGNNLVARFETATAAESARGGALGGRMLVSNNPEAVFEPGVLASARGLAPGPLATYVHHSNHTDGTLSFYLRVRGAGAHVTGQIVSAAGQVKEQKETDAISDPNMAVAAGVEDLGDAKRGAAVGATPSAVDKKGADIFVPLTDLAPVADKKIRAENAPLMDSRGLLNVGADNGGTVDVDVVSVPVGAKGAALTKAADATARGNAKYQTPGTNGRAAGLYNGAELHDDQTIDLASLDRPRPIPVSHGVGAGSESVTPMAADADRKHITIPSADTVIATVRDVAKIRKTDLSKAAITDAGLAKAVTIRLLHDVMLIAPDWLHEKGLTELIGSPNAVAAMSAKLGKDGSYGAVIAELYDAVHGSLTAWNNDAPTVEAVIAAFANHATLGADGDYASYGTIYELGFLLRNSDANQAHGAQLSFVSPTPKYRGVISVDGVDHPIVTGEGAATRILASYQLAAGDTQYVRVQMMSPGQIYAGQELRFSPT